MSEEKVEADTTHVHFPEVRSFRVCREELTKKLEEIDRIFEELEKRRNAMIQFDETGVDDEDD